MRISGTGALVGAGIGGVARSAVVFLNLEGRIPLVFVIPSAVIGLLVGAIAGAMGKPVRGALLGAFLSAVVFELFMLPCSSLIGTFGTFRGEDHAGTKFLADTLIYGLEMGVAGALAGGLGGLAGHWKRRNRPQDKVPPPHPDEHFTE